MPDKVYVVLEVFRCIGMISLVCLVTPDQTRPSNCQICLSQIAKCIRLLLTNVFVYLFKMAKCICFKMHNVLVSIYGIQFCKFVIVYLVFIQIALWPSAMGAHFFQNGDQMGTLASRMGTQKAHVCKIDRNKLIR